MRVSLHCATTALLVAFTSAPALAQGNPTDPDTREVLAYRLTMPKLRQLNAFVADLHRQRDADPAYRRLLEMKRELAALQEKEEITAADEDRMAELEAAIDAEEQAEDEGEDEDQSLGAMVARMEADPRIAGALKRTGLAPREAAVMQFAFFQAAFTAGMLEAGTIKEIPPGVNAENVRFCQAHKDEIATLTALGEEGDQERD